MRIGDLFDVPCAPLVSIDNTVITSVTEIRYLGVHFVSGRNFRVSMERIKRSFNRVTNGILSRLQGVATEDIILHMIRTKSLPILLYATEATNLLPSTVSSLDFCVTRFVMKVFRSSNRDIIKSCLDHFDFKLPSVLIQARKAIFENKFKELCNSVCSSTVWLRSI